MFLGHHDRPTESVVARGGGRRTAHRLVPLLGIHDGVGAKLAGLLAHPGEPRFNGPSPAALDRSEDAVRSRWPRAHGVDLDARFALRRGRLRLADLRVSLSGGGPRDGIVGAPSAANREYPEKNNQRSEATHPRHDDPREQGMRRRFGSYEGARIFAEAMRRGQSNAHSAPCWRTMSHFIRAMLARAAADHMQRLRSSSPGRISPGTRR
jgi:hypothetical protein